MTEVIGPFRGKYFFLSNFSPSPLIIDGIKYQTAEHAYQAAKSNQNEVKLYIASITPGRAKRFARTLKLFHDWEQVKVEIMSTIVSLKFSDSTLKGLLLSTGKSELVEINWWGDTFWGKVYRKGVLTGENNLGRILMRIRDK